MQSLIMSFSPRGPLVPNSLELKVGQLVMECDSASSPQMWFCILRCRSLRSDRSQHGPSGGRGRDSHSLFPLSQLPQGFATCSGKSGPWSIDVDDTQDALVRWQLIAYHTICAAIVLVLRGVRPSKCSHYASVPPCNRYVATRHGLPAC